MKMLTRNFYQANINTTKLVPLISTIFKNKLNYSNSSTNNKYIISSPTIVYLKNQNIFENLAAEHWIYKNVDLSSEHGRILMLWRSTPCVVIGRHQNVFAECNIGNDLLSGLCFINNITTYIYTGAFVISNVRSMSLKAFITSTMTSYQLNTF